MKQAMVFAAGLGTRLKPLTDTMPKALVRVGDKPLLEHVIIKLKKAGFERIVVNVHHFADQIIDFLQNNHNFGIDIIISDEREALLETGGGIKKAACFFDPSSPILIHNVDILSNVNLSDFYEQAKTSDAMLLVSQRKTKRYLIFHDDMRLAGWINTETGEVKPNNPLPTPPQGRGVVCSRSPSPSGRSGGVLFAFSGIHVIHPRLLPLMEEFPDRFSIIDFYLKVCKEHNIKGLVDNHLHLLDVGKLDTLHEAEQFLSTI